MGMSETGLGNIFICGRSALRIYRSQTELAHISRLLYQRTRRATPRLPRPTAPTAKTCQAIAAMYRIPLPLDTLVVRTCDRRKHSGATTSLDADPAHAASFIELEPSIYLASPELVYYQLARGADTARAWMLAMELVGCYALEIEGDGMHGRVPLTTPAALDAFFEASATPCRKAPARRILEVLTPGARSPREAQLAALARLPRRWGGWGIPGIALNRRLELTPATRTVADRSYLEVDMYIEALDLVLEYDSDDFHLTREAHGARRSQDQRPQDDGHSPHVHYERAARVMGGAQRAHGRPGARRRVPPAPRDTRDSEQAARAMGAVAQHGNHRAVASERSPRATRRALRAPRRGYPKNALRPMMMSTMPPAICAWLPKRAPSRRPAKSIATQQANVAMPIIPP